MSIKFPSVSDEDPKRKSLGKWISDQRKTRRESKLSLDRTKKLQQLPEWSWDPNGERVRKNKSKLLEMAKRGEPRPSHKTSLGQALNSYIGKSHGSYNSEFDQKIKKIAPSWFVNTADENKKKLLEIAREGKPKPSRKTRLGQALGSYTYESHKSYSAEFYKEIRKLAPFWFINTAKENKKKLLEMANQGKFRPNKKTKLGQALGSYIGKKKGSYDAKFDKKIRKLAPHWFVNTADGKKQELLRMARDKNPRPNSMKTKLGQSLISYTRKRSKSYDPNFDKKIRALAPHWFKRVPNKLL